MPKAKEEKDEEKLALMKSRDSHLAGGELEKDPRRIRLEQPNSLRKTSSLKEARNSLILPGFEEIVDAFKSWE